MLNRIRLFIAGTFMLQGMFWMYIIVLLFARMNKDRIVGNRLQELAFLMVMPFFIIGEWISPEKSIPSETDLNSRGEQGSILAGRIPPWRE
jgi:hypothetical protein